MNFTPDRSRAKRRPRFGYEAIAEVWPQTGTARYPAARLAIQGSHWDSSAAYRDVRYQAERALSELGLSPEQISAIGHIEVEINAWWALDAKHVRNPDNNPVPATRHPADDAELAQLIKQRRYVPDDWDESRKVYGGAL